MSPLQPSIRGLLIAGIVALAASPACGQGKLEAHYSATLAGLPIGKGNWVVDINEAHYSAAASGVTTGLLRVFTGGEGTSAVRGTFSGSKLVSAIYAATIKTSKKTDEVRLTVLNGNVKNFRVEPPVEKDDERIPITDAHEHGVQDPMTASLLRVSGNGDPIKPEACHRTLAVFDGRLRYDLKLAYKRIEQVKAKKGYNGPAVVCAVYFTPVAGFVPSRSAIKYLTRARDIEVWLAPISGTRVLVPFLVQGPTPIGEAKLVAEEFITVAAPVRASIAGEKTQ